MLPGYNLTIDDAVALLVDRHEMAGQLKQALATPFGEIGIPDISSHVQRVLTPAAGDSLGQAARSGLIGAGVGGLAGAGASLFGDRRKHWLRNAVTGAMLGGSAGAALPLAASGARAAFAAPPSVQQNEATKAQQQDALSGFAAPGFQSHAAGGFTAPADEAGAAAEGRANASQYPEAAGAATGVLGRSLAEGAVGNAVGRGADRLLREATRPTQTRQQIATTGPGKDVLKDKYRPDLATAVAQGATPERAVGGLKPNKSQWSALPKVSPRGALAAPGKLLPRLGSAAGLLPLIEAIFGPHTDPVSAIQRMYRGNEAPAGAK